MPQQIRMRRQRTIDFAANQRRTERLSRGMVYRELVFRLAGSVDVGADGDDLALWGPGDEWNLIQRIELIANGSDVLRSISGEELRVLNLFWYGVAPRTNDLFRHAAADEIIPFESHLIMPFWMPNSIRPIDTALDARQLSDLRIEITFGDVNDMVLGGVGVGLPVAPTVEIFSLESFGITGPFAQTRIHRIEENTVPVSTQFQMQLPTGSMYRAMLIQAKGAVAAPSGDQPPDLANTLNNIRLRSGTTVFVDLEARMLQDWTMLRKGIDPRGQGNVTDVGTTSAGIPLPDQYFASLNSLPDSWYYLDLVTDGRLTEGIDTLGFSELILELDVGIATDSLRVLPFQIIPIRAQGPGGVKGVKARAAGVAG